MAGPLKALFLFRPLAADHVAEHEFRRVDHDVTDGFPLPGVGNMHQPVAGLNDGRIRKLARLVLEHEGRVPFPTVTRNGQVQRGARPVFPIGPGRGVIVDEEMATNL